ncbi:DUF1194 domain-containing protein [Aminobacter aminovorans]|uniref:VWFA domain-containing protein n=1 Tax=Aminobacter aminovorans TaxID=83263 RepID=A0AAC9FDV6_AMIAI|nr:DUF1194 domain-containing protein [Aminobacter aminovorans]AMS42482.1 hypothetical protein AA2016_3560 [Aminobacter aminovorans]MBB3707795.1 hypothetical protein [Aminobacter aminovorans]
MGMNPAGQMAICAALVCCTSQAHATEVDTAIVFAVDVSGSVDPATAYLQREGHAAAIASQAVLAAITRTRTGCVAITYIEWSSYGQKRSVVPWTHICGAEDAHAVASVIRNGGAKELGCETMCRTSISYAIDLSVTLLTSYTGNAANKIIDISANGINNDGLPVEQSRLRAIAAGCTINVIALPDAMPGISLDHSQYFADNVIGGPNAFVMPLASPGRYASALRQKLVREISAADPTDEFLSNSSDAYYGPR